MRLRIPFGFGWKTFGFRGKTLGHVGGEMNVRTGETLTVARAQHRSASRRKKERLIPGTWKCLPLLATICIAARNGVFVNQPWEKVDRPDQRDRHRHDRLKISKTSKISKPIEIIGTNESRE